MSERRPVVWSEGLLLSPQHLQQSDRAWRHLVARRLRLACPFDWGLARLALDPDALRNGRVVVTAAGGVLPDGTPFSLPDEDPLPASRAIEGHFDSKQDVLTISLGLASPHEARSILGDKVVPGAAGPRHGAVTVEVNDENVGQNPRPVDVQRRHFQILFPDDAVAEHDALPIGQLVRAGGAYEWNEKYVPPVIVLSASALLLAIVQGLQDRLSEAYKNTAGQRSERGGAAAFAAQDASHAMMLYTVSARIPALSHAIQHPEIHPYEVFRELLELAGQLCTFSTQDPRELPPYDHAQLGATFGRLDALIRGMLTERPKDRASDVKLESKGGGLWAGQIMNERLLAPGVTMVLSVKADIEEARYVTEVPTRIKVASQDKIDELITFGLGGVRLEHLTITPAGTPVKTGFHYYRLNPQGELWEGIRKAKDVAVFVPASISNVSLELWGVQE